MAVELNLGCGRQGVNWVHAQQELGRPVFSLDVPPRSQPDITGDVFHLPIANNSVNVLYADMLLAGISPPEFPDKENHWETYEKTIENVYNQACPENVKARFNRSFMSVARTMDYLQREGRIKELPESKNIKDYFCLQFRMTLQQEAVAQMWQVLAPNGKMIINEWDFGETNRPEEKMAVAHRQIYTAIKKTPSSDAKSNYLPYDPTSYNWLTDPITLAHVLSETIHPPVDPREISVEISVPDDTDYTRSSALQRYREHDVPLTKITITKISPSPES